MSRNFTLHLIKVGKLKRFNKVSSDLKTILRVCLSVAGRDSRVEVAGAGAGAG